ncbi:WD40 repeat-like protein [Coemansia reversa NRRL 1564]|uniref:WD40 repeat-like protein n=1 Tax=Coemansia reversa (strain ATCC 12441 / NRRL 1564) TaxID=763665 RepID=A0A2G5BKA8_COERN|nr:WD40 repeat-like protein [Coemansia reversa NRRL 1564]|eukprot:PIA19443.1 WD40 repeat-like protein [Coemansia reversa NRRL 1564]
MAGNIKRKRSKIAHATPAATSLASEVAAEPTTADKSGSKSQTNTAPLVTTPEATDAFIIAAGTYERILYGIEARFVDQQLTLNPRFIFPAHIGCIKSVSAGGRYLASGSTDEIIKVYDLKKRVELGSLHEHKGSITALQFHGSSHLLSASEDGAICIFRTKDWEPLKVLRGHKGPINSIAVHPTGKLALSVSRDRTVILWNLLTGQRASRTKTPQIGELVVWSPSGTLYAVVYATEIQVYSVGQAEALSTIFARQRILSVLVVTHKGTDYILCGCQDKRIHIFSTAGAELASVQCHENRIKGLSSVNVTFPDGVPSTIVVSISSDGHIRAWKLTDLIGYASDTTTASETPTKDVPMSHLDPLAEYNAGVRLTCVTVSSSTF